MQEHRVLIVAGENPEERVNEFSLNKTVPPYIKYRSEDAGVLRRRKIEVLESLIKSDIGISKDYLEDELNAIKGMSDEDFYLDLVAGYDLDENENAISTTNPDGKFNLCRLGGVFATPFIVNKQPVYSARKSEIDWNEIHMNPLAVNLYERTWEMCMEGLKPESDLDKQVYENMKNRQDYFLNFKDKAEYVTSNSSFWGYAFLNELDMWLDMDDCPVTQFEWMSTFYDRFIKPLPEDTKLTIFEYLVLD